MERVAAVAVDSWCAWLDYIAGEGRGLQTGIVMNNNFAFGGNNPSLIFRHRPD